MKMYWAKMFTSKSNVLIAICDEDVLDKELGPKKFKVKVSKNFYGERLVDAEIALRLMKNATIGNLFGKNIVQLAEENGFITKENVILIGGVPHAQFVRL